MPHFLELLTGRNLSFFHESFIFRQTKMLIPIDPKADPALLESARRSLQTHPDLVVVGTFKGITGSGLRRTCELTDVEREEILSQLAAATLSRVSSSRGAAIPPFYALDDDQGKLRLILYIALGTVDESQHLRTRSIDLETLAVILSLCGENRVSLPAHLIERNLEADNGRWVECSLEDIEGASRAFRE